MTCGEQTGIARGDFLSLQPRNSIRVAGQRKCGDVQPASPSRSRTSIKQSKDRSGLAEISIGTLGRVPNRSLPWNTNCRFVKAVAIPACRFVRERQ